MFFFFLNTKTETIFYVKHRIYAVARKLQLHFSGASVFVFYLPFTI